MQGVPSHCLPDVTAIWVIASVVFFATMAYATSGPVFLAEGPEGICNIRTTILPLRQ